MDPIIDSALVLEVLSGLNWDYISFVLNAESSSRCATFQQLKTKLLVHEPRLAQLEVHIVPIAAIMAAMNLKTPQQSTRYQICDKRNIERTVVTGSCNNLTVVEMVIRHGTEAVEDVGEATTSIAALLVALAEALCHISVSGTEALPTRVWLPLEIEVHLDLIMNSTNRTSNALKNTPDHSQYASSFSVNSNV
ncbi:hypothetical protein L1987_78018 [Smallanthus sonchifolius]|uniref:Uncharacterized protein n=1 Tax=Smallanthus sonchifolius TaxID=185202 RepID=A0ACB8ZBF9_9ASTR|nr:hypothetical protein L1987_78018 [Smallanthus sonchifolius]